MAHIVNCLVDPEPASIIRPESPVLPSSLMTFSAHSSTEKPFRWRMQQPSSHGQSPKYQLFPRDRKLPVSSNYRSFTPDKLPHISMNTNEDKPPSTAAGLKAKIQQHSLIRRRKVSVPELGPMTTVQEVPMDSPTIPGRPPLHERSASAPGDDLRQHPPRCSTSFIDEEDEFDSLNAAIEDAFNTFTGTAPAPQSPKHLAPLIIPQQSSRPPQLLSQRPYTHTRSGSVPVVSTTTTRQGEVKNTTLYTSSSSGSDMSTPKSSANPSSAVTVPTPLSAPGESHRASPNPWDTRPANPTIGERSMTPQPEKTQRATSAQGHRRGASSESSNIMDRGRPRKRADRKKRDGSVSKRSDTGSEVQEQKSFETLPTGVSPNQAIWNMDANETAMLQKQAYRQAERFEVLSAEDVEALSKELRRLDERVEYLRRTYTSLRAGRRNLHARICQFLRSPRVAKFNHESMLRQEEALGELDASIDDWVAKVEKADNRRTRIRQKLLEHVAAAAILPTAPLATSASDSFQQAVGIQPLPGAHDISTPPRSPSKQASLPSSRASSKSPSPQRVVAQVPSTILEHPIVEEAEPEGDNRASTGVASLNRADVESIRIYAGDGIACLLADVEDEITKMSTVTEQFSPELSELQKKEMARKRSHSTLNGTPPEPTSGTALSFAKGETSPIKPKSPAGPPPPEKDYPPSHSTTLLSSTVFKR